MRQALWLSVLLGGQVWANVPSPVGYWQVIDDVTEKPKQLVQVWTKENKLYAKIAKGEIIIKGSEQSPDHPKEWLHGTYLNINNNRTYKCYLRIKDDGETIYVRTYFGYAMLGHQQVWVRAHLHS